MQKSGVVQRAGRFVQAAHWWRPNASLCLQTSGVGEWSTVLCRWLQFLKVVRRSEFFCWSVLHQEILYTFFVLSCIAVNNFGVAFLGCFHLVSSGVGSKGLARV